MQHNTGITRKPVDGMCRMCAFSHSPIRATLSAGWWNRRHDTIVTHHQPDTPTVT